jgi:hypothetical protein
MCFVRELGHGIDRDLPLVRVSLAIAVCFCKVDLLNVEGAKSAIRVPLRQGWRRQFFADCLTNDEPSGLIHKGRIPVFRI